ncbi:hypothetical protein BX600DRAFT_472039 [Xylariales sp. PMI_506]|nr:hypothetical protein BX600DRAFT_472039 [Xylariales sp. PMI_506]
MRNSSENLSSERNVVLDRNTFDGKVDVDLRLLMKDSQWGTLGKDEKPAAIIYMEIRIQQPRTSYIRSTTIDVSLAEKRDEAGQNKDGDDSSDTSGLQFMPWFGPERMIGEPASETTTSMSIEPSFSNLGVGIGGGVTVTASTPKWSIAGRLLPGIADKGAQGHPCRTLRWELEQNEPSNREAGSRLVLHTAFTLEHSYKPFLLGININGRLQGGGRSLRQKLKFGPAPRAKYNAAAMLIDPSQMHKSSRRLDEAVQGLSMEMLQRNLAEAWGLEFGRADSTYRRLLSVAAASGNLELVIRLLGNEGLGLEEEDTLGRTALSWAAGNGCLSVVNLLLQHRASPDHGDKENRTPLSWASGNGHLEVVKLLLDQAVSCDGSTADGRTALSFAAGAGHLEVTKVLLEKGAAHDHQDNTGRTPLSWAAGDGRREIIEMLLNRAAELDYDCEDIPDHEGRTALAWAAEAEHETVVRVLLQHTLGSSTDAEDGDVWSYKPSETADEIIKMPLILAATKNNLSIMRILVQAGIQASTDSIGWLSSHLQYAILSGSVALVKLLFQSGATVDMKSKESGQIPLCTAAECGHVDIIVFLVDCGAGLEGQTAEGETPLFLAAKTGREAAVKVLLDMGANIHCRNSKQETVLDVANRYPTILRMLSEKDQDGKLAEEDPYPDISLEFSAKVVFFINASGVMKPSPRGVPVSALLADPMAVQSPEHGQVSFKWFHLPSNNMRWVEALIFRHCADRSSVYKILKPERWVGRQHHGDANSHQARFMQPLCSSFGPIGSTTSVTADQQNPGDKNLVVFMPYLHWGEDSQIEGMKTLLKDGRGQRERSTWTKDQKMLHAYLFKDDAHPLHLPHIRRTLDQFCYYTLKDTDARDKDQTVIRYQRKFTTEPKVTAMVDQLWLWVLVGPSGRADTVITCFPSKDDSSAQARSGPDPDGFTDVLQNVMLHMLYEPQAVKTAYDLAGVITSSCSRAFLGPSRARKILQFTEVYESAISDIVNQETELFDMFRALIEFRRKTPDPAQMILSILQKIQANKYVDPIALRKTVEEYYNDTLNPDIPSASNIAALLNRGNLSVTETCEILQKLGNFHVLDISREIALLREIKDIQDELNIMSMVFDDQASVLKEMEKVVRSMRMTAASSSSNETNISGKPSEKPSRSKTSVQSEPRYKGDNVTDTVKKTESKAPSSDKLVQSIPSDQAADAVTDGAAGVDPGIENDPSFADKMRQTESGDGAEDDIEENQEPVISVSRDDEIILRTEVSGHDSNESTNTEEQLRPPSEIWGNYRDPKHTSLPINTVQLSIDEIERMARRAAKANQALDFLVDLKQKQSNVMDARSARVQAEESLKMTKESEKQGKTIMVFTIVTIVFLPLSFMAAFFALNITQFRRDDGGTLGLGYVLEVMIPISALVSAGFIYIAFKVDSFGNTMAGLWK